MQGAPVQCVPVSPLITPKTLAAPSYDVVVADGARWGLEASGQP